MIRLNLDDSRRRPYVNVNQMTGLGALTGLFTIGELATEFSLSPRAIRFYEDQGLIAPQRAGTTRIYTKRDRARLKLILRGKRLGFSLLDIREFLELYDVDRTKRRQMQVMLEKTQHRIGELEQQLNDIVVTLEELREMESQIAAYNAQTEQYETTDKKPREGATT